MIARQIDRPIPIPSRFGREERVEYPIDILRTDACAGVGNRYHYTVTFVRLGFHA